MQHQKKYFLLALLFILSYEMNGQNYKPGKKGGGLYGTGKDAVDKGWYFGVGGTYTIGYLTKTRNITLPVSTNNTLATEITADPKGRFGLSGDIGLFTMNDKKLINYIDYGIAYKWFRGGEDYTHTTSSNTSPTSITEVEGTYSDHLASGHINLGYRYDKTDRMFFVNGLGLNADYHFITSRNGTPPLPDNEYKEGPDSFLGELHYFFGVGFKTGKRLIVMPIIETPIFAIYPFNHIESTHDYFNTRARPVVFKIRFMFLKAGSKSCPKVYNPMGIDPNGNLEK